MEKNLSVPYYNPMFCHNKNILNRTIVLECCKNEDYCNAKLMPPPPVPPGKLGMVHATECLKNSSLY